MDGDQKTNSTDGESSDSQHDRDSYFVAGDGVGSVSDRSVWDDPICDGGGHLSGCLSVGRVHAGQETGEKTISVGSRIWSSVFSVVDTGGGLPAGESGRGIADRWTDSDER